MIWVGTGNVPASLSFVACVAMFLFFRQIFDAIRTTASFQAGNTRPGEGHHFYCGGDRIAFH